VSLALSAAIVHYRTPDLLTRAVESFRAHYPDVPLLLIDNGSTPESARLLSALLEQHGPGELLRNPVNLHHGPAMHQALLHLRAPLVLLLDSDVIVLRGGLLERMCEILEADPRAYAAGLMTWMDERGFDLPPAGGGHPYIRPLCMLLRREIYLTLPPFERHGAPCLRNMAAAVARGYRLIDFPVPEFLRHDGRGTAARYGYRLGVRGTLNHLLHRLGF
jgi:glycosyltransferase involved in cell wall biosynthesis